MEPERWKKIEELYKAAIAQPAEKRADILERACPGDPELRAEVESLLEAAGDASSFLEGSPLASAADPGTTHAMFPDEIAGAVIGRYHLLQKIGEGGTAEGAPYFVMEYVAGVPITNYCDNHRLSTRERLDLFMRVCEGVQHAHQKAIIHRDLKPSNILVINVGGRAAPKIIDFEIG